MAGTILKYLRLSEAIVATLAYAAVAGILMVDVIGREVFSTAFFGARQLAVYGAIIAGFLGLTLATSDNAHLRPEFMDWAFRRWSGVARLGDAISGLFFFAAAYVAWTFVVVSMEAGDRAPVLYFFVWPLQLVIPYTCASAGLKHLVFAWRPEAKPQAGARL